MLAWKIADDEEKTDRWHVSVSTRLRGYKVVRLSELREPQVDSARDSNSYVVLRNRQCSTSPVVPRTRRCKHKASLVPEVPVDSGIERERDCD